MKKKCITYTHQTNSKTNP